MVYSNKAVYGGNKYDKSGHLSKFTSLEHLMMLLKCILFRASFWHIIKDTDSIKKKIYRYIVGGESEGL